MPKTKEAAEGALRYPLNFYVCAYCGHVFNVEFDDTRVSYAEDSYHMYNSGVGWQQHIAEVITRLEQYDFWRGQNAIDIGCGTGDFFTAMLEHFPEETFIGFEPGIEADRIDAFPVERDYFEPERDLKLYSPGLLCLRHVVEHLKNPREFLTEITYWSAIHGICPLVYIEVPCFDKAMCVGRVGDLIYEHVSHFTRTSFQTLLEFSGFHVVELDLMYDDEVIYAIVYPENDRVITIKGWADSFNEGITLSKVRVQNGLEDVLDANQTVALWGGTGKSAAFINTYELDCSRFPIVVDSDEAKCGKFVPGTGQEIVHSTSLLQNHVDVIVITTRWRAADIYQEIIQRQIPYDRVLYLNGNSLVDYKE